MIAALSREHEVLAVLNVTPVPVLVPTLLVATIVNRYVVLALRPVIVADTCDATLLDVSVAVFEDVPYPAVVPYSK